MYKLVVLTVVSGSLTALSGIVYLILLSFSKYGHFVLVANIIKFYGITVFTNLALTEGTRPRSMFIGESAMSGGVYRLSALKSSVNPAPPSGSGQKNDDSSSHPNTTVAQGPSSGDSITSGNV